MTLTIHDLHPGDGVEITGEPYRGAHGTVETVGSDPPTPPDTEAYEWARVVISDGVREYRVVYDLADLRKIAPPSPGDYVKIYADPSSGVNAHKDAFGTVEAIHSHAANPDDVNADVRLAHDCSCGCRQRKGEIVNVWAHRCKVLTRPTRSHRRITVSIDVTDDEIEWFDPWARTETRQLIATLDLLAENHDRLHIGFEMNPEERR